MVSHILTPFHRNATLRNKIFGAGQDNRCKCWNFYAKPFQATLLSGLCSVAKTTFNGRGIEANVGNWTCLNVQQIGAQPSPPHLTSWREKYICTSSLSNCPPVKTLLTTNIQHEKLLGLDLWCTEEQNAQNKQMRSPLQCNEAMSYRKRQMLGEESQWFNYRWTHCPPRNNYNVTHFFPLPKQNKVQVKKLSWQTRIFSVLWNMTLSCCICSFVALFAHCSIHISSKAFTALIYILDLMLKE